MTGEGDQGALIVVHFAATEDEVTKVLRFQVGRLLRRPLWIAGGILLMVAGVILLAARSNKPAGGAILLGLGLLYLLYITVVLDLMMRRAGRKALAKEPSTEMVFSTDGVRLRTALRDNLTRWPAFSEVIQWQGYYLLRLGKLRVYAYVPKRAFASDEDERRFRELVLHHVDMRSLPAH